MFEKFTERARKVMSLSRQEAQRLNGDFISTEHMLLGILQEGGGVAAKVLRNLDVDTKRVRQEIEKRITVSDSPTVTLGQLPFSPRAKRVIELSGEAASLLGHDVIGTEHLLLGLLKESEGIAAQVLVKLGVKLDELKDMILEVLGAAAEESAAPSEARSAGGDLTAFSGRKLLEHLVDRPLVQDSVMQLLLQGRNVALVGPEDSGKTSLVLALARARAGGFTWRSVDHRLFDPFDMAPQPVPARTVLFIPEGELLTASRAIAACGLKPPSGRLIIEFREGGLEPFSVRRPDVAKELVPVKVDPPGEAEQWPLLHAARTRLLAQTPFTVTDAVLREANVEAAKSLKLPPPWGTIKALWKAAPIEITLRVPPEIRRLQEQIQRAEADKDESISLQRFELAAAARDRERELRKDLACLESERPKRSFDPHLSLEAIRQAIAELAKGA
jgi:ATP-dependent Clp protease ATP-binding subunit ClpC